MPVSLVSVVVLVLDGCCWVCVPVGMEDRDWDWLVFPPVPVMLSKAPPTLSMVLVDRMGWTGEIDLV